MLERPDYNHKTPQENVNILFNMIQKCRVELAIMRGRNEYEDIVDTELVKVAEAVAREAEQTLGKRKG